ncbi:hypothetical protein J6590_102692 [Homalodisca vitripennis]|nr:hypothetical protein J6590_102692 [Homalodisca vitripennis]
MPRGECSALPRSVDTGVARYEVFPSHNVRQLGSVTVIKCSKSCLDIRKKFDTSSSNLTSSRSLFPYSNRFR